MGDRKWESNVCENGSLFYKVEVRKWEVGNGSRMYEKMGANFTKWELESGSWKVGDRKWESNVCENGSLLYKVGVVKWEFENRC